MKLSLSTKISLRIMFMFAIAISVSYVADKFHTQLGDNYCQGRVEHSTESKAGFPVYSYTGCDHENGFDAVKTHNPTWH